MENIRCGFCKTKTENSNSICPNCNYPITGNASEQSSFRMKMVDVKFWIKALESPRNLSRILAAIFIAVGFLLFVTAFNDYPLGTIVCLMIGAIYLGIFVWSKKDNFTPYIFAPIFYAIHTVIELILDLLPYNILPISIENGWIGIVPILVSLLPYIYAAFRILLIIVFIKGYMNARKINGHPKLVERYLKRVGR